MPPTDPAAAPSAPHALECPCSDCGARRSRIVADRLFAPLARYHDKRGERERAESARRAEAKARIAPMPPATPGFDQPALLRHLRRLEACPDAVVWAKTQPDPETLWAACERGDWMLWLAAEARVRRQEVVLAACACARLALPCVALGEERPRTAIETAERWARGDGTLADVHAAAAAAFAAAFAAAYAAAAAHAAAHAAAYAAAHAAAHAAAYAARAAAYVARADAYAAAHAAAHAAAYAAAYVARSRVLRECADLVRARIPWATVAAALETP